MDLQVKKTGSVYWRTIPRSPKELGSREKEAAGGKGEESLLNKRNIGGASFGDSPHSDTPAGSEKWGCEKKNF